MKTYTTEAGARRNARKRDILCIRSASGDLFIVGLEAGAEITVIDGTGEETKPFRFDDVPAFSARNGGAATDDDGGL